MRGKTSRILGRIRQQLHLILMGHVFNPVWRKPECRRKRRYDATLSAAMNYLKRYASPISLAVPAPVSTGPEPEHAFTIWFQGEDKAPELIKACFRSMRRHLKQELVVLDENTLFDWITLPDFIIEKWKAGKISHAHFCDICRIELLYEHGGIWLDATDYVTAPVPDYILKEDFFLFMAGKKISFNYSYVQNCFIRGKKGNEILYFWREALKLYWEEENSTIDYFVHQLLLCLTVHVNTKAAEFFSTMPKVDQDPTHALWGEHCADPYDEKKYMEFTKGAFFQKTNYKDKRLKNVRPGSIAEYILNSP